SKRSHLCVVSADGNIDLQSVRPAGLQPTEPRTPETAENISAGRTGQSPMFQRGANTNEPRDLTPGDHDVPPFSLGGQDMYSISPGGQEVAYTSNIDEVEATSTNNEIFTVAIAVESAVPSGQSPDALRTAHATASPKKISTS